MHYLAILVFFVLVSLLPPTSAQAELRCGDVLVGGTAANPRVHHMTRDLYTTAPWCFRMPQNYTVLDCHHYGIHKLGPRDGFGILAGGGTTRRVRWHQYRNCGPTGWAVGLRKQWLDDSLTINEGGAEAYTGNHVGIFSIHTSLDVVLGSSIHANGDKGWYAIDSYLPYCIRCSANSNGDSGMIFKNSTQPQLIDGQAHRNRDEDVVFNGSHLPVATHHGLIERGDYGNIMFANGAHHNVLHCVDYDQFINPESSNVAVCQ